MPAILPHLSFSYDFSPPLKNTPMLRKSLQHQSFEHQSFKQNLDYSPNHAYPPYFGNDFDQSPKLIPPTHSLTFLLDDISINQSTSFHPNKPISFLRAVLPINPMNLCLHLLTSPFDIILTNRLPLSSQRSLISLLDTTST